MRIYDTLSETKKEVPIKQVRFFVCGMTVNNRPHLGHGRTYVFFDSFVRYLRSQGVNVFYLQNVTDVDDKIIDAAAKNETTWKKLARQIEKEYHYCEKKLGIISVTRYARATDYIKQIVKQIQTLIAKGHAYLIPHDGYYFDITTFPDYGKLSKRTASQADDGVSRIDDSVHKRNKGDFNLWKFSKEGEPQWKTPLGAGRPGWHIEDTAITEYFFGPQYDIHGAAIDLKFPHHEAEIAQQEAASGKKPLVDIWMHTGFLLVNGQKMSKSLGNFITIENFLQTYSPQVLRYLALSYHYRSPMDYNDSVARNAQAALETIEQFILRLTLVSKTGVISPTIEKEIAHLTTDFHHALEDDFNTPQALATLFSFINTYEKTWHTLTKKEALGIQRALRELLATIGLIFPSKIAVPRAIGRLVDEREVYRRNKQFIQSDTLRNKLQELGYSVEDTPLGPFVRKVVR